MECDGQNCQDGTVLRVYITWGGSDYNFRILTVFHNLLFFQDF